MSGERSRTGEAGEIIDRGDQGRFAATDDNRTAGEVLKAARASLEDKDARTQLAFASAISERLRVPISPTTLSGWETARRTVPGPVLLAAAKVSGQSLDVLVAESQSTEVPT